MTIYINITYSVDNFRDLVYNPHMALKEKRLIIPVGKNVDTIAGGGGFGWNPDWGETTFHQHLLPLIQKGDEVLDLGSSDGRASFPALLKGATVTWIDKEPEGMEYGKEIALNAGLRVPNIILGDITQITPQEIGKFDLVIAQNTTTHMRKSEAMNLIRKLPDFLRRKGGHVAVDGPSVQSYSYDSAREYGSTKLEEETYERWCECSGIGRLEPAPYFKPGDIEGVLRTKGGRIIVATEDEITPGNYNRQVIAKFGKK